MPINPNGSPTDPDLRGRITVLNDDIIYAGNMIAVNTSTGEGRAAVAATASLIVVGWSLADVDNSADGESVPVSSEIKGFDGKSGDLPTYMGQQVYVHDANTVKATADGSNPVTAGYIHAIISGVYYVRFIR
jgi:hypothetical protein